MTRPYRLSALGLAKKRAAWARPEVRAKHRAAMTAAMARPEVRAKHRAAMTAAMARPEVRAKHRAAANARWNDPDWLRRSGQQLLQRANLVAGLPPTELGG